MMPSRRGLIAGLGAALVAAPAIVRAGSLMPVRAIIRPVTILGYDIYGEELCETLLVREFERYSFGFNTWREIWGIAGDGAGYQTMPSLDIRPQLQ